MKRLLLFGLFAAMLSLAPTASAATIYGKVENVAQYNHGALVCGVDWSYADDFTAIISGASATDQRTALSILTFLQNHNPACSDIGKDGSFSISLPNRRVYLVIIALSEDNHVYWYAEQVDASVTQVITTTAPSF